MRKGFLLAGASAPSVQSLMTLAATSTPSAGVDNLISASQVRERLAAGASRLRVECDFVTCSQ